MAPIPRLQAYGGPAVLSYGFRPFFLLGAAYSALTIAVWLPVVTGCIALPTAFSATDWHVHEMLFGYLAAVIAGFLLTAIPNWTGRLPLQGAPLLVLVLAWLAGRLAVTFSALTGAALAAAVDASFLLLLAAAAAREIVAGKNWRNLKVLLPLLLLACANAIFHAEASLGGVAEYGKRLGLAAVISLVMLIGGRIVPSFTRNWLVRENPGRLPAPFSRFDVLALGVAFVALASWVAAPHLAGTGLLLLAAAAAQGVRLARWAGERTMRDRLVLILHVAYSFVPAGFAIMGASALAPDLVPASAGLHAWTIGAMGAMTLAVMTRATLGHTARPLTAGPATQGIFALVVAAALARLGAAFAPALSMPLLVAAGLSWSAAFGGFVAIYGPMLVARRKRA